VLIDEQSPDLICMADQIENEDPYELLAWLRKVHPRISVCLLGGLAERGEKPRGEQLGIDAVIAKPFERASVVSAIEQLTG